MKKIELIELVQDFLAGGDAPDEIKGKYHGEITSNMINMAFTKAIMETYMEAKGYSDYSILDAWARNYPLNIASDKVRLPFVPVQLPNNMGIRQVTPSGDLTNAFAYRDTNANTVFAALEVNAVSTKPTFYIEMDYSGMTGEQIPQVLVFEKLPDGCTAVNVKLIVPIEQLDDYDEVAIPAGKESQIIGNVIEILRAKPPEDKINDNIANQR